MAFDTIAVGKDCIRYQNSRDPKVLRRIEAAVHPLMDVISTQLGLQPPMVRKRLGGCIAAWVVSWRQAPSAYTYLSTQIRRSATTLIHD